MASIPPNSEQFSVSVVGDQTGLTYNADFVTSQILSHRQQLLNDRLYREYLGGENPAFASEDSRQRAQILADINCALIQVPVSWREKGNGLDFLDNNVITEVWTKVQKVQSDTAKRIREKTEAAANKLKASVESGEMMKEAPKE